ncbi:hypothetical protein JOB18_018084 [Solea senegalensis]|uniref:Uncharacterized protein n=1 Tax=Solea senegalensis TaxID=28829 RepID=A0AAV6S8A3_SOLSE|nr:hypothetical protein JOB18_018084 [Solea senegalensis]
MSWLESRRDSLPLVHQAVRRRFSGPLLLPPLRRRHSCQEHTRLSTAHGVPLDQLEVLYRRALASHDEHWLIVVQSSGNPIRLDSSCM